MDVVMEPGQGAAATTGWGTSAAGQGVGGGSYRWGQAGDHISIFHQYTMCGA